MDEVNQELANQSKPQTPHTGQVTEFIPTSKFHKFRITGLIGLLFLTAVSAAYMFSQNQSLKSQVGSTQTCVYEDRVYQIGEQVPLIDSCKSCSCDTNGLVACNDTACEQESETINQTTGNVPENLLLYYSFTPPPDFPLEHTKTGMTENDERYYSSKYKSLDIILEQGWRTGFECAIQEKSEQIQVDGRELTKETWIGVPADYPDENATALCDINGGVGFRGIIIRLVEPTDQKWGHNLVVTHDIRDISSAKVDQLLEQILSTFKFTESNISSSNDWVTYVNDQLQFSFKHPPTIKLDKEFNDENNMLSQFTGEDYTLSISLKNEVVDLDNYYYLDTQASGEKTIGGYNSKLYSLPRGYCDAGACTEPTFAFVIPTEDKSYFIQFSGNSSPTQEQNQILSTYEFTN